MGETSYAFDDIVGAGLARFYFLNPTTVEITRDSNLGTARFTAYVIQLSP